MSTLAGLARACAFGRHMPLEKLARRAELVARRRLADRLGPRAPAAPAARAAAAPPQPLFAPRPGCAVAPRGAGFAVTLLNRCVEMPGPGIDWQAPGPGPRAQLSRMTLHYMEYLEGAEDALWARLVSDWLDANARPRPGAWADAWNAYALATRACVWMDELARRRARLPASLVARAEESLLGQLAFLARHLETDLGGNHLIRDLRALIRGAAYFEGRAPEGWRRRAVARLRREVARQILPDGMHFERSPSYHCQVMADLLDCRAALGAEGAWLDGPLAAMALAAADLAHPDGGVVLLNDAGLSMARAPGDCLAAYTRLIGPAPAPRDTFAFPDAGCFGMRRGPLYLVADCGRIAPDDLPAHGHCDALGFELSVDGRRVIVDQGVFEYVAGPRRDAARSTAAHNTLALAGAEQAEFFGAFRCGRRPEVTLERWEAGPKGIRLEGRHDGYRTAPGRPVHRRRFDADATGVTIEDRLAGGPTADATAGFLLHPDIRAEPGPDVKAVRLHLEGRARLVVAATAPIRLEPAVWWPDLGVERRTTRLNVLAGRGPLRLITRITLLEGNAP